MAHEAGKGDTYRPTDNDKFSQNFERIFGKKPEKRLIDMTEKEFNEALGIEQPKEKKE
jgi:hypothetical protein